MFYSCLFINLNWDFSYTIVIISPAIPIHLDCASSPIEYRICLEDQYFVHVFNEMESNRRILDSIRGFGYAFDIIWSKPSFLAI